MRCQPGIFELQNPPTTPRPTIYCIIFIDKIVIKGHLELRKKYWLAELNFKHTFLWKQQRTPKKGWVHDGVQNMAVLSSCENKEREQDILYIKMVWPPRENAL